MNVVFSWLFVLWQLLLLLLLLFFWLILWFFDVVTVEQSVELLLDPLRMCILLCVLCLLFCILVCLLGLLDDAPDFLLVPNEGCH